MPEDRKTIATLVRRLRNINLVQSTAENIDVPLLAGAALQDAADALEQVARTLDAIAAAANEAKRLPPGRSPV